MKKWAWKWGSGGNGRPGKLFAGFDFLFSGGGKMVVSASYPLNRNLKALLSFLFCFLCIVMYVPVNRAWDGDELMSE